MLLLLLESLAAKWLLGLTEVVTMRTIMTGSSDSGLGQQLVLLRLFCYLPLYFGLRWSELSGGQKVLRITSAIIWHTGQDGAGSELGVKWSTKSSPLKRGSGSKTGTDLGTLAECLMRCVGGRRRLLVGIAMAKWALDAA